MIKQFKQFVSKNVNALGAVAGSISALGFASTVGATDTTFLQLARAGVVTQIGEYTTEALTVLLAVLAVAAGIFFISWAWGRAKRGMHGKV